MRHVDEGTIHAWLDDQITDPAEAAWIEEHLRDCAACSARLAEERSTLAQAHALLSVVTPAGEPPAFQELEAKAGNMISDSEPASVARRAHGRRWLLQAGWAASLALAIGIGWTAREFADREAVRSSVMTAASERAAASAPDPRDQAVAPLPSAAREMETGRISDLVSNAQVQRPEAAKSRLQETGAPTPQTRAPRQIANTVPPPPAPDAQGESTPTADRTRLSAAADAPRASAAPAAAPAPAQPPQRPQTFVTVSGEAAARVVPVMQTTEWRMLPRTEAAARSGMPLYGIDGLQPVLTGITTDDRIVQTMYRLDSGVMVELEQQRASPGLGRVLTAVQATRPALTSAGRGGIAADVAPTPRIWSDVRGDIHVTLRTTSAATDLDALATKLRVD